MSIYSKFLSLINGVPTTIDLASNTLQVAALEIGSTLLSSSAGGAAGSKLVGDDNSYSNFTPTAATVKGALSGIDAALAGVSGSAITQLHGDVSAVGPGNAAATVNSVGGSSAANIHSAELAANAATNANTASTIVKRDSSGNFSAGTITASLSGNATNITGVVALINGGTGTAAASANAAFNALSPMTTLGDIIIGGASGAGTRLAVGATNKVLSVVAGSPAWAFVDAANVTYSPATPGDWGGGTDANTALLLHLDNSSTDSSQYAATASPTGTIAYDSSGKFSQALELIGDGLLAYPANAGYALGSGDFTIEFWAKPTFSNLSTSQSAYVCGQYNGAFNWAIDFRNQSGTGTTLRAQFQSGSVTTSSATVGTENGGGIVNSINLNPLDTSAFHHYAIVRNGSAFAIYQDGVVIAACTISGAPSNTMNLSVGGVQANASVGFLGDIDEFRLSTGIARYTAAFSPPSSPFSAGSPPPSEVATALDDLAASVTTLSGSAITSITGDATGTGPGATAITLATVNSNVGSFGSSTSIPSFTVNAKGLVTAASGNAVIAPAGTLSGTTLNSSVVSSSLTSVGTLTSGTWNATTIAIAHGGTGQTSAASAFAALSPLTTAGDIIFENSTPAPARLAIGSTGQVLTVVGGLPAWAAPAVSPGSITLTQNHILVGNASNLAADVAMSGEASIVASGAITLSNAAVIAKVLTGYVAGAGTVSSSDSILSAIEKVDGNDALKLPLAGGTMSGNIAMGGNKVTGAGDPSAAQDYVTLSYMNARLNGLKPKQSVRAASTANITIASALVNGSVVDGVTLATGDRVLLKNQTSAAENGIYIVVVSGAASRSADFDSLSPIDEINGAWVSVQEGTVAAGMVFVQYGLVSTLGTDAINFEFFNPIAGLIGGDMITFSGSTFSVDLATASGLESTNPGNVSGQLRIKLEASNPSLKFSGSNELGVKFDAAGALLSGAAGVAVQVDGSTIEISSDALRVKDAGITLAKLASNSVDENKIVSTAISTTGALNGGSGTKLSVRVDNSTLDINGSNNLEVKAAGVSATQLATGAFDQKTILGGAGTAANVAYAPSNQRVLVAGQSFSANTSYAVRWGVTANGETAGRVYAADPDTTSFDLFYVIGFASSGTSVTAGQNIQVTSFGSFNLSSSDTAFASGTDGAPVFLTSAGAFSVTAPSASASAVVRIGMVQLRSATAASNIVDVAAAQFMGIN